MNQSIMISTQGCRLYLDDTDIVIDPFTSKFVTAPDAIIYSCPEAATASCLSGLNKYENIPVYAAASTKKMLNLNFIKYKSLLSGEAPQKNCIDEIISCRQRTKNTLRKNGIYKADIIFSSSSASPGTCSVVIKTPTACAAYIHGNHDNKPLPDHDILIINANKKTPLEEILQKMPNIVIKADDFSHLYNVLDYFNSKNLNTKVGIDETVLAHACEYLKMDCTVFSNTIKPLSSYRHKPPVIITNQPSRYENYISLPSTLFIPAPDLQKIYRLAMSSSAKKKIAICSAFNGIRNRGDLIICGGTATIEL